MAEPGTRYSQAWHWNKGVESICTEEDSKEQDKYGYKQEQENYDTRGEGDFITFRGSEDGSFKFNFWGSELDQLGKSAGKTNQM